jgi:WD40 repeat protein
VGTDKGLVVVWDVQTGREICRLLHTADVRHIALSEDGVYVGAATSGGEVRVWAVQPEILIEKARSRVTRNLDEKEWKRYFGDEPYRNTFETLVWDELQMRAPSMDI